MKRRALLKDFSDTRAALVNATLQLMLESEIKTRPVPSSPEDLWGWINDTLGMHIPRTVVCPDHNAPFQFVSDLYFYQVTDALVLANRAGGKTEDAAILHLVNAATKDGHATSHIGAIENQARRCYEYYLKGLRREAMKDQAPEPKISETNWINGSKIEILPGTEAQTQGGHPHLTAFDELEQGKYQPYENSKGMSVEYTDMGGVKRPGQFVAMSTRQSGLGLMQKALDDAERNDLPIYTWCVFETMEPCDGQKDRPSCDGVECPLWEWCGPCSCGEGEEHGRAVHADGWRSRGEVIRVYQRSGRDTWEAQHLCRKPETKALIYKNWTRANIDERAEWLTIKDEEDRLVPAGTLEVAYDWGFTDSTWIGLMQRRGGIWYLFDELTGSEVSERTWVRSLVARIVSLPGYDGPTYEAWEKIWQGLIPWPQGRNWPELWPNMMAGDPSAVELRSELKEHGFSPLPAGKVAHRVESGQDVLRAAILTAGDLRRLVVHPRCKVFTGAVSSFRAKQLEDGSFSVLPDPQPANHAFSHPLDAMRYYFWTQRRLLGLEEGPSKMEVNGNGNGHKQTEKELLASLR